MNTKLFTEKTFSVISFLLFILTCNTAFATMLGQAYVSNVVAQNRHCLQSTTNNGGIQFWDITPGGTYTITLSNVIDGANGGTDATIHVIVKSSQTGNTCVVATQQGTGVYTFDFTLSADACATLPILYCTNDCNTNSGMFARHNNLSVPNRLAHLRAASFDGNCNKTNTAVTCNIGCPDFSVAVSVSSGTATFCEGDSVTLCASGALSYLWSNEESTPCITVYATQTLSVKGFMEHHCESSNTPSVNVLANPIPTGLIVEVSLLPVCGVSGNMLCADATDADTYLWTVSSSDNSWIITGGQGTHCITYTAGSYGTSGTFALSVANSVTGCAGNTSSVVTFGSLCFQNCSRTQGFYGNTGGKDCHQTTTAQKIASLLATPLATGFGNRTVTILAGETNCLMSKLPANAAPAVLPVGNVTCATATGKNYLRNDKFSNVLIGQTITLGLNLRMDASLGAFVISGTKLITYASTNCVNGTAIPGTELTFDFPQSVLNCLGSNNTVQDLLNLANRALGSALPAGCTASLSDINAAVDAVNRGFDACRISGGFMDQSTRLGSFEEEETLVFDNKLNVTAYPNPFNSHTTIEFQRTGTDAHTTIEVYSYVGNKVGVIFDGATQAGVTYKATLSAAELSNGIYLYSVISENNIQRGKLLLMK